MLEEVKKRLGITGDYQDDTIQGYIEDVKQFLLDGGVDKEVVNASSTVGVIARGVSDLWNYGSGGTSFSPYFLQRAIQLSSKDSSDIERENTDKNKENDKGDENE
jgi:hypothetical protein